MKRTFKPIGILSVAMLAMTLTLAPVSQAHAAWPLLFIPAKALLVKLGFAGGAAVGARSAVSNAAKNAARRSLPASAGVANLKQATVRTAETEYRMVVKKQIVGDVRDSALEEGVKLLSKSHDGGNSIPRRKR